jgi:hypothetical protein
MEYYPAIKRIKEFTCATCMNLENMLKNSDRFYLHEMSRTDKADN